MSRKKNLAIILTLVILVMQTPILALDDPIAHWTFDEGTGTIAHDSAGTNDGTVNGAVWTTGKIGGALEFSAVDHDSVVAPSNGIPMGSSKFTIAAWIYPYIDNSGTITFWGESTTNHANGFRLHSPGMIRHYFFRNDYDLPTGNLSGRWSHVALVHDGEGNRRFYLDGMEIVGTYRDKRSPDVQPTEVRIGAPTPTGIAYFDGIIDDVRIYDRPLSPEEIEQLYSIELQQQVAVDIRPGSCPNPLNLSSRGVLPVAILGSEDLDVNTIDVASIRLEGIAPIRSHYEDVGAPVADANECNCSTEKPDGYTDLNLKFKTREIATKLLDEYEDLAKNDVLVLTLTGVLTDQTPIKGEDCITIRGRVHSGTHRQENGHQHR